MAITLWNFNKGTVSNIVENEMYIEHISIIPKRNGNLGDQLGGNTVFPS